MLLDAKENIKKNLHPHRPGDILKNRKGLATLGRPFTITSRFQEPLEDSWYNHLHNRG